MGKVLLEEMIIEETKGLPFEALNEILDFIQFLKTKKLKNLKEKTFHNDVNSKLTELDQMSLKHLEDEFVNYKEK